MRFWLILAMCLCLGTEARAFVLDDFMSGTPKAQVEQKLRTLGLEPSPKLSIDDRSKDYGPYTMTYCKDTLVAITKKISAREFNSRLIEAIGKYGNPNVEIPSLDSDVLWLRWSDGDFALNSGIDTDGLRFHNITEIDRRANNMFCRAQ